MKPLLLCIYDSMIHVIWISQGVMSKFYNNTDFASQIGKIFILILLYVWTWFKILNSTERIKMKKKKKKLTPCLISSQTYQVTCILLVCFHYYSYQTEHEFAYPDTAKPIYWHWILLKESTAFICRVPGEWAAGIQKTQTLRQLSVKSFEGQSLRWEGFPGSSAGNGSSCNAGDLGSIPGLGRSPGEGNVYLLQYSCLENSMDRGAWCATYSPWGHKELDTTQWHTLTFLLLHGGFSFGLPRFPGPI